MYDRELPTIATEEVAGQDPAGTENLAEFFRDDIRKAIDRVNDQESLAPTHTTHTPGQTFVEEPGIRLRAPSARLGKHATILFLDLEKEGRELHCVLRSDPSVAESYKRAVAAKPVIEHLVPRLYDVHGGEGMELEEVVEKLGDETFRSRYAQECADAVIDLSNNDVYVSDVVFGTGWNVMAREDGSFRFIEQSSLAPEHFKALAFDANERLAEAVFSNLIGQFSRGGVRPLDPENLPSYDFAFQFLADVIQRVDPESLSIRYRYLRPSHEAYRNSFGSYRLNKNFWQKREYAPLEPGEYERMSDAEKPELPWVGNTDHGNGIAGRRLNPELITAVKERDLERFAALITEKKAVIELEDVPENREVLG